MPKHQSVLETGASLSRGIEAYFDLHPLDHDDDIRSEHGVHGFDDYDEDSIINTTASF